MRRGRQGQRCATAVMLGGTRCRHSVGRELDASLLGFTGLCSLEEPILPAAKARKDGRLRHESGTNQAE